MCVYLFGFEACEAEHPDLVGDMLPVKGGALLLQTSHQLFSHLNDAVSHTMDLLQPGMNDSRVIQIKKQILEYILNTLVYMKEGDLSLKCLYKTHL